jgi:gliding motility-associated-like protein
MALSCDASIPPVTNPTVLDDVDGIVVPDFTEMIVTDDCNQLITRTWTATDNCGQASTVTQIIVLEDTSMPTISGVPDDLTVACSDIPAAATPIIEDDCDTDIDVVYHEEQNGSGCFFELERTWVATDNCGNSQVRKQTIFVVDNTVPVFTNTPADVTISCGNDVPVADNPMVADNCDLDVSAFLSEETIQNDCGFTIIRTWTATDDCNNSSTASQIIQVLDNTPPLFTDDFPDLTLNCADGSTDIPLPTATDDCALGVEITFSENDIDGDCATGLNKVRTWIATDFCGNVSTATQSLTIFDEDLPILAGIPQDITTSCNAIPVPATPMATDNCDTDVQVIFEEIQTGSGCNYLLNRTWSAIDNCGNTVSESQIITITDTAAPTFSFNHPLLQNISSGDTLIQQCGATDIFSVDEAIVVDDCDAAPVVTLNEGNIIVSTCDQDDYLVWMECYWEATDDCGNSSQFWIYIKVVDTTLPELLNLPADVTLDCGADIPNPIVPDLKDNCTATTDLQFDFAESITNGNCEEEQMILRTWTVTDDCQNTSTFSQTIVIEDSEAPTISDVPNDITIDEAAGQSIPNPPSLSAWDNCAVDIEVSYSENVQQNDCEQTLIRTWTATDNCGNQVIETQTILFLEDCSGLPTSAPVTFLTITKEAPDGPEIVNQDSTQTSYSNTKQDEVDSRDDNQSTNEWAEVDDKMELEDEIVIYSGFSPNHDGINDFFIIKNIEKVAVHEVVIFDKWGKVVFQSDYYQNDWDGTYQNNSLPQGVYYYIFQEAYKQVKTGYIQINY